MVFIAGPENTGERVEKKNSRSAGQSETMTIDDNKIQSCSQKISGTDLKRAVSVLLASFLQPGQLLSEDDWIPSW